MFVALLSFLALASAAPHYNHRHTPYFSPHRSLQRSDRYGPLEEQLFDVGQFWKELATEMHQIDEMINALTKNFPQTESDESVESSEYKIKISLKGFDEKDIIVKAREGALVIQAVHSTDDGNQKTYLNLRTLPSYVNVAGSWTYDKEVLEIVFPLNKKTENDVSTTEVVTTEQTKVEEHSREDMERNDSDEVKDADIALDRGDTDKVQDDELLTNVIPKHDKVEATTYAVDLKDEFEFVPMRY